MTLTFEQLELIAQALVALENVTPNSGKLQERIRELADKVVAEQAWVNYINPLKNNVPTPQQILKTRAIAFLAAWKFAPSIDAPTEFGFTATPESWGKEDEDGDWEVVYDISELSYYLISLDAIIPVVREWCGNDYSDGCRWDSFIENLWTILKIDGDFSEQEAWRCLFQKGNAENHVDALLKASGKWTKEME